VTWSGSEPQRRCGGALANDRIIIVSHREDPRDREVDDEFVRCSKQFYRGRARWTGSSVAGRIAQNAVIFQVWATRATCLRVEG
jgi:hypothetical protein